jgi:hypothetical protein
MRLPEKLVERIADRIIRELTEERIIEWRTLMCLKRR